MRYAQDGVLDVRASSLGRCRRQLWYHATGELVTDPPSDAALLRMQIGTVLEPVVVDNVNTSDAMPYDLVPWTGGSLELNVWAADDPNATPGFASSARPTPPPTNPSRGKRWSPISRPAARRPTNSGPNRAPKSRTLEAVVQLAAYQAMLEGQGIGDVNAPVLLICLDTGAREWDWERIPATGPAPRYLPRQSGSCRWWMQFSTSGAYVRARAIGNNDPGDALDGRNASARRTHPSPRLPRSWTPQCKTCPFAQACRPEPVALGRGRRPWRRA